MSRQPHIHTHNCGCTAEMRGSGALSSLYGAINMDKVVTLNEAKKDTGKGILKPYDNVGSSSRILFIPHHLLSSYTSIILYYTWWLYPLSLPASLFNLF